MVVTAAHQQCLKRVTTPEYGLASYCMVACTWLNDPLSPAPMYKSQYCKFIDGYGRTVKREKEKTKKKRKAKELSRSRKPGK